MGAAYGTAKSGVGIASMGVMRPELVMKSIVPVVMAGVLGIYGLIIAVIISTGGKVLRFLSPDIWPASSCTSSTRAVLPSSQHLLLLRAFHLSVWPTAGTKYVFEVSKPARDFTVRKVPQ